MSSGLFDARWAGKCKGSSGMECLGTGEWSKGDQIGYDDDDELVCEECHPGDNYDYDPDWKPWND